MTQDPIDAGDDLDDATDELNAALAKAEEYFVELNLGITADVTLLGGAILFFGRMHGQWGLFIAKGAGTCPLKSAPRKERVLAASAFETLHEKLIQSAGSKTNDVLLATKNTMSFLKKVGA